MDSHWNELLAAIATAEPGWLDLAAELRANSDAESSALSTLLWARPYAIACQRLRRLDGKPFSVRRLRVAMASPTLASCVQPMRSSLSAAQAAAVAKVQGRQAQGSQSACLQRIRVQQRR
jgi:hypothetical protein